MQRILVLNRGSLAAVSYDRWLRSGAGDSPVQICLLSDAHALATLGADHGYDEVVAFDDYTGNPAVELAAAERHATAPFDRVIAQSERDVLRAARLRAEWGVTGQLPGSAVEYRDKLVQKQVLRDAGIPVTDFRPVTSVSELIHAGDAFGHPFVVKPLRSVSSEGVVVLDTPEQARRYGCSVAALRGDESQVLLAERYVDHVHLIVDGICRDGEVLWAWPSWMSSNLGFLDGAPLVCGTLAPDDPLTDECLDLVRRVIGALRGPGFSVFHAEIFATPHGLLVNEIASRIGGGRIDAMLAAAFTRGPLAAYLRAVGAGHEHVDLPPRPERMASFALVRPRPGVLRRIPAASTPGRIGNLDVPGLVSYEPLARAGDVLTGPTNGISALQAVVTAGDDAAAAADALSRALSVLALHTEIEPGQVTG